MSVTSCRVQYESQNRRLNSKFQESVSTTWMVTVDSRLDGPKTIHTEGVNVGPEPLPILYAEYNIGNDYDQFLLAKDFDFRRVQNTDDKWYVTVTYDNTLDVNQGAENPLDRAPVDDWGLETYQRVIEKDIEDTGIVNSAGQPYDPPLMSDDTRPILVFTRNEPTFPQSILAYQDAINSDTFLGVFPPYTAKVNIAATKMWESGIAYYAVRYTFNFRHDTWRQQVLNRGTMFRPTASANAVPLPAGAPPLNLADDGTPLATDGSEEPTYKTHKIYRELPFGPLGIVIY